MRMEGKRPLLPTSFSPLTSTNVGSSPKNFSNFNFDTFATLLQSLKTIPSANPKLLNLKQGLSSKKLFFYGQILIKLGLFFSHRNARLTKIWSHDHTFNIIWITWSNFVGNFMNKNYDVITFTSKYLFEECLDYPLLLTSSKLQPCWSKQPYKTQIC